LVKVFLPVFVIPIPGPFSIADRGSLRGLRPLQCARGRKLRSTPADASGPFSFADSPGPNKQVSRGPYRGSGPWCATTPICLGRGCKVGLLIGLVFLLLPRRGSPARLLFRHLPRVALKRLGSPSSGAPALPLWLLLSFCCRSAKEGERCRGIAIWCYSEYY